MYLKVYRVQSFICIVFVCRVEEVRAMAAAAAAGCEAELHSQIAIIEAQVGSYSKGRKWRLRDGNLSVWVVHLYLLAYETET